MAEILIADDDPSIREILRTMLVRRGHQVREAADGQTALAELQRCLPDLLVTDLIMPGAGGLRIIQETRRLAADLPILAISGGGANGRLMFLSTAQTFPGVKVLAKPFRLWDFLHLVEAMLEGQEVPERPDGLRQSA